MIWIPQATQFSKIAGLVFTLKRVCGNTCHRNIVNKYFCCDSVLTVSDESIHCWICRGQEISPS